MAHAASLNGGSDPAGALRLARTLHDTVVQRLCGLSLLLEPDWAAADQRQHLCRRELASALSEMRSALEVCFAADAPPDGPVSAPVQELEALCCEHPGVAVVQRGLRPARSKAVCHLLDTAIAEALRNARKHAAPRHVEVGMEVDDAITTLRVHNDGVGARSRPTPHGTGLGLRLLATEAALLGGTVRSTACDVSAWRLELTLPTIGIAA